MAGPKTDASGQIIKKPEQPQIITLLDSMKGEIARALPRHITPDRMLRVALTALRTTPDLLKCTTASLLGSIMSAAQLGLEPNTPLGMAYLIPYKTTCQLIIGYQGYLDLARRSGMVAQPYAHVVREGDEFHYLYGLYPDLKHVPSGDVERESKPITHVYAVAHLIGKDVGPPIFRVLTKPQIDKRRARSASAKSGPWVTDEEAMTLKTGIRAIWPWLPKNAEMATASALDEAPEIGRAQAEQWDPKIIDAMRNHGVVVEAETANEENADGSGDAQDPKAAAQ